jgi:PAS domain S-box-containing protein
MITLSVDGVVQSWNPAAREVFGWTEEEVVGRLLPTVLDSELDQFQEFLISVAREKTLSGIERRRVRKDGTEIDVRIWTVLMEYPEEGGEKEILIVLRDVTEEKEAKKQLDQAMKMEAVGRLAGGVAHDFNNLLTIIAGYAGMVKSALPENDPLAFDIEEVVRAAERARLLTSQLLAFSRRQVIQPKILDPNILVRNVSKMIQRLIGEDIQIVYNLRSDGSIRIDPGQFEQVLMNLCINSRDAMPEGGVISISTERSRIAEGKGNAVSPGEYIIVSVSDTGHGMDKQTKAHIFEPYFTTKEVGKGTGLGLPTIYGIVKQNAGHITFSSEQGRGTEFRIFFPLIRAEAGDVPASHTTNLWPRGTETILVLEDEDGVRNLAMRILQNQGYTVIGTDNGIEARRICLSGRVDLLLSDIVLPGVRGTEIANQMKALCSGMKVLLMTGYADREVGSGTRVLVKPFSPEALVRMVREVLDESTK